MTPQQSAYCGDPDDRESGLVLILVALMMSILLLLMSLILSGGEARRDKVLDGGVADSAVLTGAALIPITFDMSVPCSSIINYLSERLKDPPSGDPSPCGPTLTDPCSSPGPAETITYSSADGMTIIEITNPIPDDHALMAGQPIDVAVDGVECERIGVRIHRSRTATIVTRDIDLRVDAVARVDHSGATPVVTLIR